MTGKGVEVRIANEAVIVKGKRAKVERGNAVKVKNEDEAVPGAENVDSEAVTEVLSMFNEITLLAEFLKCWVNNILNVTLVKYQRRKVRI